ncbi:Zn(II)2Cys6 transcription factor domain-containing protein [Aspergillus lucknowensis]|uniref:Zn(2)-C6 fungal-type domain-containing protein n=1 Tax=Aspergillus lucknowensis TaxID=176173 RepID=A0ABR4LL32_9EURO
MVRACTNCVRAKARCSVTHGEKCERCHRMNKDCHPSPPVRKRRAVKKQPRSNARVEELEEKFNQLVVLLQSTSTTYTSSGGSTAAESDRGSTAAPVPPAVESTSRDLLLPAELEPSISDSERYLDRFRSEIVANLPFLVLSPSITARQLRQERPLLWLSIITVACTRPAQQRALSKEVRAVFGREAFVEGTRDLDFLCAVLVYAAWDKWFAFDKCITTSLVHLAISILYELGLDKPPCQDPGLIAFYDLKERKKPARLLRPPTLEERRLVLGCFLVSTVSSIQGKGESLKWTPYFDQCVRALEEKHEHASDLLLTHLAKLRLISEHAAEYLASTEYTDPTLRADASVFLKSLHAQLRTVKSTIPPELRRNKILLLELHNMESTIHQVGFLPVAVSVANSGNTGASSQAPAQAACMHACMQSAKDTLDTFLTIPPAEYVGFTALVHTNMMRAFITLYRLAIYEHPAWDAAVLHENVDVSWALGETSRRFAMVKDVAGLQMGDGEQASTFDIMAGMVAKMKRSWDAMVAAAEEDRMAGVDSFGLDFMELWDWPS